MDQIYVEQMLAKMSQAYPAWNPNRRIWADNIANLDRATAAATCRWVIANLKKPPSIAEWIDAYKAQRARMPDEAPPCRKCHGDGWVTDTNHPHHWPGPNPAPVYATTGECACNVVKPCDCTVGTAIAADIHRRIIRERERRHAERSDMLDGAVPPPPELLEARRVL